MYDRETTNRDQLATATDRLLVGGRPKRWIANGTGALPARPRAFSRGSAVDLAKAAPRRPSAFVLLLGGVLTTLAVVASYWIAAALTP